MPSLIDLTGETFGCLTVVSRSPVNVNRKPAWVCLCACGQKHVVRGSDLHQGKTTNCGCTRYRNVTKHGASSTRTPEYRTWMSMKQRCNNPHATSYQRYGGRGIRVCERWQNSFSAFLEDMGARPSLSHTLDRKDNDGDYSPNNCYWASKKHQSRNRANNRLITHNGETHCLTEWAEVLGIDVSLIRGRIKLGWTFSEAVSVPVVPQRRGRGRDASGRFAKH